MPRLEKLLEISHEIIGGRRSQAAIHLALNKKLIADIANIHKQLIVTICTNATNCYNRVAYPYASICCQYFGLELLYLLVLVGEIQPMKIYLHTLLGISSSFYSSSNSHPFQEVVQENGTALALWLIIMIFLTCYLYLKQIVTQLFLSIFKIVVVLAALLYIDDIFNDRSESATIIVLKVHNLL